MAIQRRCQEILSRELKPAISWACQRRLWEIRSHLSLVIKRADRGSRRELARHCSSAKGSTHETDSLQSSTSLTTPPAVQGVGASETHDGGASSLALLTQSTDERRSSSEVRDGGENRHKSMTGNHGEHSEGRDGVETMPKEGNAMEHLIKDLEELSPVASSHEEKKTSKISETSKELSKTIDVWVNGKGVKASGGRERVRRERSLRSPRQDLVLYRTSMEEEEHA
ncbi:hypothetical protein HID58_090071 [Brassica napus]|uniref:Uncharacterized protein n=1 Tax=Brassica napus TaxID=3708 RepID=A0ABQ7XE90_BRANA|nr:hypothetical protein HID58_090071 [Brassica napus]